MAEHGCRVTWERQGAVFSDLRYSRAHRWRFDGGVEIPASASPHVVPVPLSDPGGVDPEEAFVAAVSSCHMLTFLWLAAKRGFIVDAYVDDAVGIMGTEPSGRVCVTRVALRPAIRFSGPRIPGDAELAALHHEAHEQCFIANSIRTEIVVEAPLVQEEPRRG